MAKTIIGTPTLNGKPIEVTDSWDKMTFAQYLRYIKSKDDTIEKLSVVTGIDYDLLKKSKIGGLPKLLYIIRSLKEPPKFPEKPIKIGAYTLPLDSKGVFDIQYESLAQFEDMRLFMEKTPHFPFDLLGQIAKGEVGIDALAPYPDLLERLYAHTEAYATYCALYLQKIRDGEYDSDKALKMVPELMNYPASDIISAGGFFFVTLQSLSNGTISNSRSIAQPLKKPIGKRSKGSSARTRPLTRRQGR